jgi:hypothetical protein
MIPIAQLCVRLPRRFLLGAALAAVANVAAQDGGSSTPAKLTPAEEKAADMRLPPLDRSALEPEKRTPTEVPSNERNPFGLLAAPEPEEKKIEEVKAETEEMKLRRVLGNMRVGGRSGEPGDYRVLLGSMLLQSGDTVPKLFANQAEVLRVQEINDRQVVLTFVEKKQDLPPRTIGLAIDLEPRVRSLLPGELFTNSVNFDAKGAPKMDSVMTDSVQGIIDQMSGTNATSSIDALLERPRALLGDSLPQKNETPPPEPAR